MITKFLRRRSQLTSRPDGLAKAASERQTRRTHSIHLLRQGLGEKLRRPARWRFELVRAVFLDRHRVHTTDLHRHQEFHGEQLWLH